LRKFAAAILIGLLFAAGAGAGTRSALAQGVVTFNVTNHAPYIIMLKMFSQTRRGWVWPSPTTHFILSDSTERAARLACEVGEKICFGASYSPDDTPRHWGVGIKGDKVCTDCCLICGPLDQDVSASFSLVE